MTTCIIAEKPSVARDIAHIVGATSKQDGYMEGCGYVVTWAMGHLIALAMPEAYGFSAYKAEDLPIRPNPFQLVVRQVRKDKEYVSDPAALKQLKVIRSCFDKVDRIIVATDAGREGELIFRYIHQHLNCHKPFDRLWISSLTDKAIREGLSNLKPGSHYDNLYHSAKARSEADWLVGINASRALSIVRKGGYSLGRVQTPTLAMVCRRYIENRDFSSVPYWKLSVEVEKEGMSLKAVGCKDYENEASAQTALAALRSQSQLTVESVVRKVAGTPPPLLYDLTALQKDANRRHGFSADKTLSIAQSLYEKKITTYPRTGSRYISEDVFEEVPALLHKIGKTLSNPLNRHSVDNAKVTDHHAIIPTGQRAQGLTEREQRVYDLVARHFIAAFYPDCLISTTSVEAEVERIKFKVSGKEILSPGWRTVFAGEAEEAEPKEGKEETETEATLLPTFVEGERGPQQPELKERQTQPPKYYTEATLLRAMETAGKFVEDEELREAMKENGIGRPSTRANIIETLFKRGYIEKVKRSQIHATETGKQLIGLINYDLLKSAALTGQWEYKLRQIERRELEPRSFIEELKEMLRQLTLSVLQPEPHATSSAAAAPEPTAAASSPAADPRDTGLRCPRCGAGTLLRGRSAFGCSAYSAGCSYRIPFASCPETSSPEELGAYLEREAREVTDSVPESLF